MPENEFEKQVQERLNELRLSPSASVWERVEAEIREKKRRRFIFFFILPLGAGLLLVTSYELFFQSRFSSSRQRAAVENTVAAPRHEQGDPKQIPVDAAQAARPVYAPTDDDTTGTAKTNGERVPPEKSPDKANGSISPDNNDLHPSVAGKAGPGKDVSRKITTKKETAVRGFSSKTRSAGTRGQRARPVAKAADKGQRDMAIKDPVAKAVAQPSMDKQKPDREEKANTTRASDSNTVRSEAITTPGAEKKDSTSAGSVAKEDSTSRPAAQKKMKMPGLKWGIDASAGVSFNNDGTLHFVRTSAFDRAYNNSYANAVTGGGTPAAPVLPPSAIRPGAAFRIGIVAEWRLSPRSSISVGLQYAYQSNRIRVGALRDTSVLVQPNLSSSNSDVRLREVYQGPQANDFTNRYHFLRLPISYSGQLNKGKKLPLLWSGGLSFDYLVRSNALLYSSALGGVYYRDRAAYQKLHVNINTGLSVRFAGRRGSEWTIGPELSLDLNRLITQDDRQYLMFGGLGARFLFPPKKK